MIIITNLCNERQAVKSLLILLQKPVLNSIHPRFIAASIDCGRDDEELSRGSDLASEREIRPALVSSPLRALLR